LYLLGALAIAAPIVFHLIRRAPRGNIPFSSLMFLAPSSPRLSRRSRLDHLLLLLLRAGALGLLAFAFMRPFLRQAARLDFGDTEERRVALLIDTSASMRRGNLWQHAQSLAREAIASCRAADQLAIFAFDRATESVLGFEESRALDPARRSAVAEARLNRLSPSWGSTRLGQALLDVVSAIDEASDSSPRPRRAQRLVIAVTDLQQGSRLDELGEFEWPRDVELELKTVVDDPTNAGLQWVSGSAEADRDEVAEGLRVRVSNEPGSRREAFELQWRDERGSAYGKTISVYVPPGESRVVRLARPQGGSRRWALQMKGDAQSFDNTIYLATEPRENATVIYLGMDAPDDPSGLLYYLERLIAGSPQRGLRIEHRAPNAALNWDAKEIVPLIVLSSDTTPDNISRLQAYVRDGGTLLYVIAKPGRATTLAALAQVSPWDVEEAALVRDTMLGEIAFDHPLFAPLSGPQFNDFTKIHFWKHRRVDPRSLGDARVIAKFENGDAAVIEKSVGKGQVVILTSGWGPSDSQLARSSKFVPLIATLAAGREATRLDATNYRVGDRVPLPAGEQGGAGVSIRKPDSTKARLAAGSAFFADTDQPGVYTTDSSRGARSFAVNLDPSESKTAPLHAETLEQLGCRVTNPARRAADRDARRQMHNAELEGRQKLWRWLIVTTIGILLVETALAGRLHQPRLAGAEAVT
jgi:hypothetical protein